MKKKRYLRFSLIGVVMLACSTAQLNATPIVSEGFDYALGALTGKNGGTGFSGAWTTEGTTLNVSAGTLSDGLLPSVGVGNKATIDSSGGSQISTRPFDLPSGINNEGSELWYSFIFQDGGSPSSSSDFSLFDTGTSGPITLRLYTDKVQIRFGGTTLATLTQDMGAGQNVFVGRVTFSDTSGGDTHSVWWNPTGIDGGLPTGGLSAIGDTDKDVNELEEGHVTLQGGSAWLGSYDEIRLGTTLGDVLSVGAVPEPSTYAVIFGFGVFGLVFWRRRK